VERVRGGLKKAFYAYVASGTKGRKKCCKEQLNGTPGNVSRNCQSL